MPSRANSRSAINVVLIDNLEDDLGARAAELRRMRRGHASDRHGPRRPGVLPRILEALSDINVDVLDLQSHVHAQGDP